jgi:RNA polymerase primary sigma factor
MARFRIDSIAGLARQMLFTPAETRSAQVFAAEALLHEIDPLKAYPLDFVVFRITGYHPRSVSTDLLTGIALQHDLGLLIEEVSKSMALHVRQLAEPVLSIDDVTERFNVTSKTIQRWRRRGLAARRFIYPDGKRRVGFLLSSVERFFSAHRDQVERGTTFSQVDRPERLEILRRARRLAEVCRCCQGEITRRIGRRLNRSPLTILHTIRKHDQEQPSAAIFPHAAKPLDETDRARILRAYRHGESLATLARQAGRTRSAIYRTIIEERIARLSRRKMRFIDDTLYHQPAAVEQVDAILSAAWQTALPASAPPEESRIPRDLPPYLRDLYRTPLLTPPQERALFLKLNLHRYQFVQARRRLEPQFARVRQLDELEGHLRRATETKNQIVRANLRLVVSIARRHLRPGLDLMELISDGNLTLMRAIDSFDIHKGNRFSTYATLALMKGFARSVPLMRSGGIGRRPVSHDDRIAEVADARQAAMDDEILQRDELHQLLSRLNERERAVLLAHYGIGDKVDAFPATYEQVGLRMGLSKQRVRQIEQIALAKLRSAAG